MCNWDIASSLAASPEFINACCCGLGPAEWQWTKVSERMICKGLILAALLESSHFFRAFTEIIMNLHLDIDSFINRLLV